MLQHDVADGYDQLAYVTFSIAYIYMRYVYEVQESVMAWLFTIGGGVRVHICVQNMIA